MLVRYKLMVSEMGIILLGTPEDVDIVYSAWRHAAVHITGVMMWYEIYVHVSPSGKKYGNHI